MRARSPITALVGAPVWEPSCRLTKAASKPCFWKAGKLFREDAAGSRSDQFRAMETSQNRLLRLFGAPEKDKRHVVEDGRHVLAPYFPAKEGLAWLDRYLGPVAQ
jgi:hypothetical protein